MREEICTQLLTSVTRPRKVVISLLSSSGWLSFTKLCKFYLCRLRFICWHVCLRVTKSSISVRSFLFMATTADMLQVNRLKYERFVHDECPSVFDVRVLLNRECVERASLAARETCSLFVSHFAHVMYYTRVGVALV